MVKGCTSLGKEDHEWDEEGNGKDGQEPENSSPSEELGLLEVRRVKVLRQRP
jgi:hypothetical protein